MSIAQSHLNSAVAIIEHYKGEEPLAAFLRKYFAANKKYGSKDRKNVAHLCYCYFRLGKAFAGMPTGKRIMAGLFLCSHTPHPFLTELKPLWSEKVLLSAEQKFSLLEEGKVSDIFPWQGLISEGMDYLELCRSFLVQPDLFVRIRPGKDDLVISKLHQAGVLFSLPDTACISFNNSTKINDLLLMDAEVVIQDYSSQKSGDFLRLLPHKKKRKVWDCCAASGGKSIMAVDILGDIDLTVSDVRESILVNLSKRFSSAGIKGYKCFMSDIAKSGLTASEKEFDLIIADVPCSGSGTWARTPEQLYYFDIDKINYYQILQRKILDNILPALKPGGFILYITCSVFSAENEMQISYLQDKYSLQVEKQELIKGYDKGADNMFAALLHKPL